MGETSCHSSPRRHREDVLTAPRRMGRVPGAPYLDTASPVEGAYVKPLWEASGPVTALLPLR